MFTDMIGEFLKRQKGYKCELHKYLLLKAALDNRHPVGIEYLPSHDFLRFPPLFFPYKTFFILSNVLFLPLTALLSCTSCEGWAGRGSEVSKQPCGCQGQHVTKGDIASSPLFLPKYLIYCPFNIAEISNISKVRMNLEASWQYSGYQHVGCNDKTALATILFFFLKSGQNLAQGNLVHM